MNLKEWDALKEPKTKRMKLSLRRHNNGASISEGLTYPPFKRLLHPSIVFLNVQRVLEHLSRTPH